jgi:RHS repeat-associated protein
MYVRCILGSCRWKAESLYLLFFIFSLPRTGAATITVSTITNNLRFPGQYFDAETGLNYNFFRDYSLTIGRYIEANPIGIDEGDNHLFTYVSNNPILLADPIGDMAAAAGAISGGAVAIGGAEVAVAVLSLPFAPKPPYCDCSQYGIVV